MFIHNFKYSLKTLFRNKSLIFWTFAFPIILGTFFNLAFSDIENNEKLDIIDIAIVNNENFANDEILKTAFENLSDENNEERLFNTKYVKEEEAKELLENNKISGYLVIENNDPIVVVKNSGIQETILKYVTEEITQNTIIIGNIAETEIQNAIMQENVNIDYEKIYKNIFEKVQNQNVNLKNISNSNLSYTMIEFYTLIAMSCLYSGMLGITSINQNLPDMSSNGKRIAVSPLSKFKVIISSVLASYITALVGLIILLLYTVFILKVDYGSNLLLIALLGMIGTLAGLSIGIFVGTCLKVNENSKTGILIAFTMVGCFLSGMMGITMKYLIDTKVSIINKINPASMITDGFYSLYYYDTLDRFFFNVASLLIFSAVLILISCIKLRRQKYDSI